MSHKHRHEHQGPPPSGAPDQPGAQGQPAPPSPPGHAPPQAPAPGPAAAPAAGPAGAAPAATPEAATPPSAPDAAALQAERDDLLSRLQRVSADYLNYQKRIQKEVRQSREFANEELLKALLPVLDDLQKAIEAGAAGHPPDDPLLTGVRLIQEKVLAALGQFGLAPIECLGRPFDPDRHSAVVQEPSADHPPHTVVRELRKGYAMNGRTIRPAMVAVSAKPPDAEPPKKENV
jgi:molecular chaperone GrpE